MLGNLRDVLMARQGSQTGSEMPQMPMGMAGIGGAIDGGMIGDEPMGKMASTDPQSIMQSLAGSIGGGKPMMKEATQPGIPMGGSPGMGAGIMGSFVGGLPNPSAKTPPKLERFQNAQEMIGGYQNGWNPNPVLTNLLKKKQAF